MSNEQYLETVTIYRSQQESVILDSNDTLTLPELFPGWELPCAKFGRTFSRQKHEKL